MAAHSRRSRGRLGFLFIPSLCCSCLAFFIFFLAVLVFRLNIMRPFRHLFSKAHGSFTFMSRRLRLLLLFLLFCSFLRSAFQNSFILRCLFSSFSLICVIRVTKAFISSSSTRRTADEPTCFWFLLMLHPTLRLMSARYSPNCSVVQYFRQTHMGLQMAVNI